jgi:hypothetical protein
MYENPKNPAPKGSTHQKQTTPMKREERPESGMEKKPGKQMAPASSTAKTPGAKPAPAKSSAGRATEPTTGGASRRR